MSSTSPAITYDPGDFVVQNLPIPIQKNYNIFRLVFNNSLAVSNSKQTTYSGFDSVQDKELTSDDPLGRAVNIIGLLVALLVSAIIIVGVAFIIRKIRKHQSTNDEDECDGTKQGTIDHVPEMTSGEASHTNTELPQVFTITFTEVPKKQTHLVRILPQFLRPKPKQVDIEKIKKELSHVYVY